MTELSFNTLSRQFSKASLLKCVSDFTTDAFFRQERSFLVEYIYIKDTTKDENINISSLKKNFKNLRPILNSQK